MRDDSGYRSKCCGATMHADAGQLAVFTEALHMGDGNKQRGQDWMQRSYHIGISRKTCADRLQSLLIRKGWRATLS